jgi:phosphopantothenoylcysteine decarboxylase/phosphopantothenate--cysteine ligase
VRSGPLRILLTAGPTREPIDAVRFISNRSSGKMGAAIAAAAQRGGHKLTLILGPVSEPFPPATRRLDVETSTEMHEAVLEEFPNHDVLIMAAAVADYRPRHRLHGKVEREPTGGTLTIDFEPTDDIIAAASRAKRRDQRTVAFSLETANNVERARQKMTRKAVDLMVYNPADTMSADTVDSVLLYPDGRSESLPSRSKPDFADILIQRVAALFASS